MKITKYTRELPAYRRTPYSVDGEPEPAYIVLNKMLRLVYLAKTRNTKSKLYDNSDIWKISPYTTLKSLNRLFKSVAFVKICEKLCCTFDKDEAYKLGMKVCFLIDKYLRDISKSELRKGKIDGLKICDECKALLNDEYVWGDYCIKCCALSKGFYE